MEIFQILTLIALALSLLWPFYQLIQQLRNQILKVRLTRNIFFRYNIAGDVCGECIFLNPVLLAERGNILIKEVNGRMVRLNENATKSWEIEFIHFGERVRNPSSVVAEHYFQSSSPLNFITKDHPVRAVYFGRIQPYVKGFQEVLNKFIFDLMPLKKRVPLSKNELDKPIIEQINRELILLSDKYASCLTDQIQLEYGEYHIDLKIVYTPLERIFVREKTAYSKIEFVIEPNAKQTVCARIPVSLYTYGYNYLFDDNKIYTNPEYAPVDVKEVV